MGIFIEQLLAMILVFTAVIMFFTLLFWNAERFNRMAARGMEKEKNRQL
jgi:hypothetical protein